MEMGGTDPVGWGMGTSLRVTLRSGSTKAAFIVDILWMIGILGIDVNELKVGSGLKSELRQEKWSGAAG